MTFPMSVQSEFPPTVRALELSWLSQMSLQLVVATERKFTVGTLIPFRMFPVVVIVEYTDRRDQLPANQTLKIGRVWARSASVSSYFLSKLAEG